MAKYGGKPIPYNYTVDLNTEWYVHLKSAYPNSYLNYVDIA